MSCEIKTLAKIDHLSRIQDLFGFAHDDNWLNAVYYSISPTGDLMAIGHGTKMVLLTSRWNEEIQQNKYTVQWKVDLDNKNDVITAIICLPVMGFEQGKQSLEWTCVAIGLASGFVKFFTDSGLDIFTQKWHDEEPVQSIKVQQSNGKLEEELHIYYTSCMCIIQKNNVFPLLRNLKHHYQKTKLSSISQTPSIGADGISCKKWSYGGKNVTVNDAVIIGQPHVSTFDHMLTASMEGGFHAKYKHAPPQHSLVIGVGSKPYTGFHWAMEGYAQPVLADVARAVASKIKSSLPGWLMRGQAAANDPQQPTVQPAESMSLRYGLYDIQRTGMSVWLAPEGQYAAVTDNLGRIVLIDCFKGLAVRIWKGYRDAQCSFVRVKEKLPRSSAPSTSFVSRPDRRRALFLVIFAPRRSCLEIWSLQRGPKIAAFNASKHGQLIYNSHNVMGSWQTVKSVKYSTNSCIFFDPSDETLKEIIIPFHCALSDSNSVTAKDIHLLKIIKLCIKSANSLNQSETIEEMRNSCKELQTNEMRLKCIEMLVKNSKVTVNVLHATLQTIISSINLEEEKADEKEEEALHEEPIDLSSQLHKTQLKKIASNYNKIVEFYLFATDGSTISAEEPSNDSTFKSSETPVNVSHSELENLQKFIDLSAVQNCSSQSKANRVTFSDNTKEPNIFIEYLSIFNCYCEGDEISLHEDKSKKFAAVGQEIFSKFLEKRKSLHGFDLAAANSSISNDTFALLFISYWLDKQFHYSSVEDLIDELTRFTAILHEICTIELTRLQYDYNNVNEWWQKIRELLLDSSNALMGVLAGMMCRNYAVRYRLTESDESYEDVEKWEEVPQESAEWSLLISKLDDIAVLGAVLGFSNHLTKESYLPPLKTYDVPEVSLRAVVSGGKGIVSELVSKWILTFGIDPKILLENTEKIFTTEKNTSSTQHIMEVDNEDVDQPSTSHQIDNTTESDNKIFLNYLQTLRQHFPYSLQSGVVLLHLTWQYMCHWSKNMSKMEYFSAAILCLDAIKRPDFSLKHGLCCMIWKSHLKIPLEATTKLINKTGRLPKEKMCLQDIGITDGLVAEFLELCLTFLEHFASSIENEKLNLCYEELVQEGPIPLSLLAIQHKPAVPEIVNLQKQLNLVLLLISALNIRYTKPVHSLFDAVSNKAFFEEISKSVVNGLPRIDSILQKKRSEFLCKAISATMDCIREDLESVFLDDHFIWMTKIERLAGIWDVETDTLKRHQIVELYANGWDEYAEQQLESVLDTANFGPLMLMIAGKRLNLIAQKSPTTYARIASVGPQLTDYLSNLNKVTNYELSHHGSSNITLEKLIALTGKAFNYLSHKDSKDLRVAGQMFDAVNYLTEFMDEE